MNSTFFALLNYFHSEMNGIDRTTGKIVVPLQCQKKKDKIIHIQKGLVNI